MHYLLSVYRPTHAPAPDDATMRAAIDDLNDDMVAAGVRVFVGGLRPTETAHTVRQQPDGTTRLDEGPVQQMGTFYDGLWVLDVASREEALEWGRKAAAACRAEIEVRPFY